jgi:hypothetical protein
VWVIGYVESVLKVASRHFVSENRISIRPKTIYSEDSLPISSMVIYARFDLLTLQLHFILIENNRVLCMPTCKVFIAPEILTTPKGATTPFPLDHLGIALRTGWYPVSQSGLIQTLNRSKRVIAMPQLEHPLLICLHRGKLLQP